MRIHELTLIKKIAELQQVVHRINPLNSSLDNMKLLMNQKIIKWSKPDDGAEREVVGGVLFQFQIATCNACVCEINLHMSQSCSL